jgi:DNA adenine methylase
MSKPAPLKPLLKWAGGKRWLVPLLQEIWAPYQDRKLVEPFTGGMAVALALSPQTALLNDANSQLINFYRQVSKGLKLTAQFKNEAEFYYASREQFNNLILKNSSQTKQAAGLFYYLIRTGFNGLCRFNSSGEFNVPFGQHTSIKYKTDFLDYQDTLSNWELTNLDFEELQLEGNEFLYADPPYDVEFTRYNARDFTWNDQLRLAKWLAQHKGPVIASNQATPRILELYKDLKFKVCVLPAPRMISCNGDRRPAMEILAVKGLPVSLVRKLKTKLPLPEPVI